MNDPIREVARVTIEFVTPFLIAQGSPDLRSDAVPVFDANGLPTLPGTSIAGVLRHAYERAHGDAATSRVFGDAADEGGSRLWVSWGKIHDSSDRPVDGLELENRSDSVLDAARAGSLRDHVRIGHRGAAVDSGKFDQMVIGAGHRFTFELVLECEADGASVMNWLLGCLASNGLRLGGSGRRGLGRFRMKRCLHGTFDLRTDSGARGFAELPTRLDVVPSALAPFVPQPVKQGGAREFVLDLAPDDYWFVGGGDEVLFAGETAAPDMNPFREARVRWRDDRGSLSEAQMVVPGTSIKGALAHRVAYHANRILGRFADSADAPDKLEDWCGDRNPIVAELFGRVSDGDGASEGGPRAGRVFIDDIWLGDVHEGQLQRLMHTSLDRFTGGVRSGILYDERAIFEGPLIKLTIRVEDFEKISTTGREAFRAALRDLAEGRLSFGAGGGRGHGYFRLGSGSFQDLWEGAMS